MKHIILIAVVWCSAAAQSNPDRPVRLDDIERDNLKSPQQTPPQRSNILPYQTPYQPPPGLQYVPQYYQSPSTPSTTGSSQLFAHPSLASDQLSAYHQQVYLSQPQQPILIPQHSTLPFPVMLIPSSYLLPQEVNALLYASFNQGIAPKPMKYAPAQGQQIQSSPIKDFRPSPQINPPSSQQYQVPQPRQPQHNVYQSLYQPKYATDVKSTIAPPLKDNNVG